MTENEIKEQMIRIVHRKMCSNDGNDPISAAIRLTCNALFAAGYRLQSETAREFAKRAKMMIDNCKYPEVGTAREEREFTHGLEHAERIIAELAASFGKEEV